MPSPKVCTVCGVQYPDTEFFCPRDGSVLRVVGGDHSDLVGQIIADRYRVLRKLGEGGMGSVYLAEHVKMGRKIALKVLKPSMVMEPDAISRFNREAANASKITHTNVAAVHDFGETTDGVIFLAMEFVDGLPLSTVIEHMESLPPQRVANIIRQAADGLSVAHDLGIIHRDLKPDNIMVATGRDGTDVVKVVDFGIAKAAGNVAQKVTKTGLVVGTPEYMSPEQLSGDPLDSRSDIYSLGLVAFNALTGRLPFPSESTQESMIMRLTHTPRTLAEMRPDVSWTDELQRVIERALERDPAKRYQNAADFGRDLANAIARMTRVSKPVEIAAPVPSVLGGPSAVTPSAASARREPWRMAAFVSIGASVFAAGIVGFVLWRGGPKGNSPNSSGAPLAIAPVVGADSIKEPKGAVSGGTKPSAGADSEKKAVGTSRGTARDASTPRLPDRPLQLTVGADNLSPALRRAVEAATRVVPRVVIVHDPNQSADLVLRASSTNTLSVRRPDGRVLMSLDTAAAANALVGLFRHELAVMTLDALDNPDTRHGVELQIGHGKRTYAVGDAITVAVRSERAGYLTLIETDENGVVTLLHPQADLDAGQLTPRKELVFDKDFTVSKPLGNSVVRAIITNQPLGLKREGPVLASPDGPALAETIRQAVLKTATNGAQWSTFAIAYTVK